jgi:hypothetical protein
MKDQLVRENIIRDSLYDQDQHLWRLGAIAHLQARDFQNLDVEHLLEEIEILAGRDRAEVESRLGVLLAHLLKRIYVNSAYDHRGWEITIREQRRQLRITLQQSPSLRKYFEQVFDRAWQDALMEVREDYPNYQFPDTWQFSYDLDKLLTEKFWRDSTDERS